MPGSLRYGSDFMLPHTRKGDRSYGEGAAFMSRADLSTHIFAITSPPGGVHIFACLAAFATLRPNLAYFRLLPPYGIL